METSHHPALLCVLDRHSRLVYPLYMRYPTGCLERNPDSATVKLAGKHINMAAIARSQDIDRSYLSRILSGKREPTIPVAKKIAAALGLGLEELLEAIEQHVKEIRQADAAILQTHNERIRKEDEQDLRSIQAGIPTVPRLPGLRAK